MSNRTSLEHSRRNMQPSGTLKHRKQRTDSGRKKAERSEKAPSPSKPNTKKTRTQERKTQETKEARPAHGLLAPPGGASALGANALLGPSLLPMGGELKDMVGRAIETIGQMPSLPTTRAEIGKTDSIEGDEQAPPAATNGEQNQLWDEVIHRQLSLARDGSDPKKNFRATALLNSIDLRIRKIAELDRAAVQQLLNRYQTNVGAWPAPNRITDSIFELRNTERFYAKWLAKHNLPLASPYDDDPKKDSYYYEEALRR